MVRKMIDQQPNKARIGERADHRRGSFHLRFRRRGLPGEEDDQG